MNEDEDVMQRDDLLDESTLASSDHMGEVDTNDEKDAESEGAHESIESLLESELEDDAEDLYDDRYDR
jgi:hypothetical protein